MSTTPRPWRTAMAEALYGPAGFFRESAPADHFRTSAHVSSLFASALLRLAEHNGLRTVVDVGAGRGELLCALHDLDPTLRLVGVEVADRPGALPTAIEWATTIPTEVDGLLVANEWLDNVPLDVVEVGADGIARRLLVDPDTGAESPAEPVCGRDRAWLDDWWPLAGARPGRRAEIGWPRDDAWADAVSRLRRGLAIAIDYAHTAADRPYFGSLTGYRSGRQVPPVPDGKRDLTAHVALDSCGAAAAAVGIDESYVLPQHDAIRALLPAPARPSLELARDAPATYLAELSKVGEYGELCDPAGIGKHTWLVHSRGIPITGLARHNGRTV